VYANCSCNAAGRQTLPYYFIGFAVLAAYYPMYLWRKAGDKKKTDPGVPTTAKDPLEVTASPEVAGP
jgi:hypothetical protein